MYTLELLRKSYFQPSTTKTDNIDHPTIKIGIWPLGGFEGSLFKKIKNLFRSIKSKVIYFKLQKYETSTNFFLKL